MDNTDQAVVVKAGSTPANVIEYAMKSGATIEKLEQLLTLQERYEANEARKAYNVSMVEVHKNIPIVAKSLDNNQTHSKYAALDMIICKAKEVYTNQGFSISFYEGETSKENHIRICADVIHSLGHKETFHYDVPLDGVGIKGNPNMTAIHAKASSTSYARRYLMCMIWNIPTGDDDDAQVKQVACVSEVEGNQIADMIVGKDVDCEKFCKAFGIKEISELPKKSFNQAMAMLKAKVKA